MKKPKTPPAELVKCLRERDPEAAQVLGGRYRSAIAKQIAVMGSEYKTPGEVARLVVLALNNLTRLLVCEAEKDSRKFDSMSWNVFDRYVQIRVERMFCEPVRYARNKNQSGAKTNGGSGDGGRVSVGGGDSGGNEDDGDDVPRAPSKGSERQGPFRIDWCAKGKESPNGDWWERRFADGMLALAVGDVTGHGWPAALLADGMPLLFRVAWMPGRDLETTFAFMYAMLRDAMPDGYFVETTIASFAVPFGSDNGRACFVPKEAVAVARTDEFVDWIVARPTWWLGVDYGIAPVTPAAFGSVETSFSKNAQAGIVTDGWFDQPTDGSSRPNRLGKKLKQLLTLWSPTIPLSTHVLNEFLNAVTSAGHQHDDLCLVSVRYDADADLVYRASIGDNDAVSEFLAKFDPLLRKLVRHFFPPLLDEDILQDARVYLYQKLPKWSSHGRLAPWVKTVVWRYLSDHKDKCAKRPRSVPIDAVEVVAPAAADRDWESRLPIVRDFVQSVYPKLLPLFDLLVAQKRKDEIINELGTPERTYYDWCLKLRTAIQVFQERHDFNIAPPSEPRESNRPVDPNDT